jgi:predicted protein tyrosine phosphatase
MTDFEQQIISEVVPNEIYIGSYVTTQNKKILTKYNIQSILSVCFEITTPIPLKQYKHINIKDETNSRLIDYFNECYNFINTAPKPLLIHCYLGMSRSATIAIMYLMMNGMTLPRAYNHLKQHRRLIEPNNGFMHQLYILSKHLYEVDEELIMFINNLYNYPTTLEKATDFVNKFDSCCFDYYSYWAYYCC